MNRAVLRGAALAAALATAACVETTAVTGGPLGAATGSANMSVATWQVPGQLQPVATGGTSERLVRAFVPETGWVRGTPEAVASVGTPLEAAPGPNRTVETCRTVVQSEAERLGAREVEAVSAGPHRRNGKGQYVAPVRMRITYVRPDGYEVRLATMTCIVDRRNRIVDASL